MLPRPLGDVLQAVYNVIPTTEADTRTAFRENILEPITASLRYAPPEMERQWWAVACERIEDLLSPSVRDQLPWALLTVEIVNATRDYKDFLG